MQRSGITRERLGGLCLLGVLLFSPLMISLFDRGADELVFGIPVLILYLFGAWGGLILAAALLVQNHYRKRQSLDGEGEDQS